jgi:acyl-CoA synthetase (AMP-forming)/AMP-acid ligase II
VSTLVRLLDRGRSTHPDRSALVFGAARRTHAELHERTARLGAVLAAGGVRVGDRVALLLHNGLDARAAHTLLRPGI